MCMTWHLTYQKIYVWGIFIMQRKNKLENCYEQKKVLCSHDKAWTHDVLNDGQELNC